MVTVTVEEAQAELPALIKGLGQGEVILITQDARPVAQLVPASPDRPQPVFGNCKGKLEILSEDEEHLAGFSEYMK